MVIYQNRKDVSFVYKHFSNPYWQIVGEYHLLVFPITLAALFENQWMYFFALHLAVFFIPILKLSKPEKLRFVFLGKLISGFNFEYISGLRSNFMVLSILYTLSLVLSMVKLFPLIGLWLIAIVIQNFYIHNESIQMLQTSNYNAKMFLMKKIKFAIKFTLVVNLPILLINSIFQPDMIMFNVLFVTYQCLAFAAVIVIKYSSYIPKVTSQGRIINVAIINIGFFSPYLMPLAILIFIHHYRISQQNLTNYLND